MQNDPLTLDLKGLKCPLPVLKTKKALGSIPPGHRILVITTDPMAFIDIPHFCREQDHQLVATQRDGETGHFLIEKA